MKVFVRIKNKQNYQNWCKRRKPQNINKKIEFENSAQRENFLAIDKIYGLSN
jgi:hypothetical protein